MPTKYLHKLQIVLGGGLRSFISYIISFWIIFFRSQECEISSKKALVFSPHQDDETLGCGGTIALKRSLGVPVKVVYLTDGRHSRPSWISSKEIIEIRKQEALAALHVLGVDSSEAYFLNQVDGSLEFLSGKQRQQTTNQLAQLINSFMPEEIYIPHRDDCHKDHEETYKLVLDAVAQTELQVEIFQYPIWIFWQSPTSLSFRLKSLENSCRVAINSAQDTKKRAIHAYHSQAHSLPYGFLRRFFMPYEIFFRQ